MISNTGLPASAGILGWIGYPLFRAAVWREGEVQTLSLDDDEFSFTKWVAYSRGAKEFDFESLFQAMTFRSLSDDEIAGYAAPFPDRTYLAGPRIFPYLVPSQLRQNQRAMVDVYEQWEKPFMTAFSDSDPVTAGRDQLWQELVPGATGQVHTTVTEGGHFVQEDQPKELARLLTEFAGLAR